MTHLEFDFESPIWRHLYRELSRDHSLIRYDARGNGLSDRDIEDVSLETFVSDLEAVVDASGLERFALLGISQGCAVSIAYVVRHPERITHLALYGGVAVGSAKRALPEAEKEQKAAMLTLMRVGWGQENAAFRQLFTSLFVPGGTKEQADWFNELQRISTSLEDAVRNAMATREMDVSALLSQVTVPTLVMHARDDACIPFELGRRLAGGIPAARFVSLPSRNHLILEDEPAFPRFSARAENVPRSLNGTARPARSKCSSSPCFPRDSERYVFPEFHTARMSASVRMDAFVARFGNGRSWRN